jgi:F420-non-reducing hydrogenase large subunit
MGARMVETIAGKAIHPVAAVPGGWSKPLTEEERKSLVEMAVEQLEFAKFSMAFAKENIFPKYLDAVKTLAVLNTGFMGLVDKNGALNLYDGKMRMMDADGKYEDFEGKDYLDHISEHVEDWSFAKFPYNKLWGEFSMDLDNPVGIYRVNTLARINVCDKIATPLAQKELEEFRASFGRPAQQTLLYHWARLIELLYNAERVTELLNDSDITGTETRVPVTPRAARGVGVVEAPRGTLIHDYTTDDRGLLTACNLIVATVQNNAAMNMSVLSSAKALIKDGKYDEGILNMVEMTIRAYDPCLSCASHDLDGRIAVKLDIVDASGEIVDTLTS